MRLDKKWGCHWCCGRSKDTGKCTGTAAAAEAGRCGGGEGGGVSPPAARSRTALLALFLSQFLNQPTLKHQE